MNEQAPRPVGWRWWVAAAVAALPALAVWVGHLTLVGDVPARIASHWGLGGDPNGFSSEADMAVTLGALAAVCAAVAVGVAVARGAHPHTRRFVAMCAGALGALFAGIYVTAMVANSRAADAHHARLPAWWMLAVAALVACELLAVRWATGVPPAAKAAPGTLPTSLPRVDLAEGQRVAAVATITSKPLLITGGIGTVAWFLVGATVVGYWSIVWLGVLAIGALVVGHAVVRADQRGLTVRFGPAGWPRVRVPLEEIVQAEAADIRPHDWGGWGYRVRPSRRALVFRGGPGLQLALTDGRRFAVTIDHPEEMAAALNGLIARRDVHV